MHIHASKRRGLLFALALVLAGCGGDPESAAPAPAPASANITGQVFKGPLSGATVCVYAIDDAAADKKGALVPAQAGSSPAVSKDCVVTGNDGSYSYGLPAGTSAALLVEATRGTWCSDESTPSGSACTSGTPVSLGATALRTVVSAPASGTVSAPLTLLTTAATQAAGSLSPSTFQTAYDILATRFGVPTDASIAPADAALVDTLQILAHYVGTSTADLGDILGEIADGKLTPANTNFPAGVEFAVGADQKFVRMFKADATGVSLVSTTALPGIPGSWSRAGTAVTVTMPDHNIRAGLWVPLTFKDGAGHAVTNGMYPVSVVDAGSFTVTVDASGFGTTTSGTLYRDPVTRLPGHYTQKAGDGVVSVTLLGPSHGLMSGDWVDLHFLSGGATDLVAQVKTVVDNSTLLVQLPSPAKTTSSGDLELRLGSNYTSFDVAMHPSGKWLYVASGYDCFRTSLDCQGGDVITTFKIEWNRGQITPMATYRTSPGESYGAPRKLAINRAGTLLVNVDYGIAGLRLWTLDATTGALSQVTNSGIETSDLYGVIFSDDGRFVYEGGQVFTVGTSPFSIARTQIGMAGNSDIFGSTLFSIDAANGLYAFSLADPSKPSQITTLGSVPTNSKLSTRDGKLLVTAGPGGLKSYTFNGKAFAPAKPASGSAELQRDGSGTLGDEATLYSTVNLNAAGTIAVSTYFTLPASKSSQAGPPTGYLFATVGSDGQLSRIADLPLGDYVQAARFFQQPQ